MKHAYYNEVDPKAAAWLRELIKRGLIAPGDVDERSIKDVKADEIKGYTQVHLFAGIGGWSLALRLAGWLDDRPVWTGSCPCQPFSTAGKRKGVEDDRHLWPEMFRLVRECRPAKVFGEQVASAIRLGWLDGVFADLERANYACGSAVLGAHSVCAPHKRQRLFWVADAETTNGRRMRDGEKYRAHAQAGGYSAVGWLRVSFAADCAGGDEYELGDECSVCGLNYTDGCECPGPTQDGYEYREIDGVLYARKLGDTISTRPQGHAGNGDDGREPGRIGAHEAGSVAEAGGDDTVANTTGRDAGTKREQCGGQQRLLAGSSGNGPWSDFIIIPCGDGKARRLGPGITPLAHGIPARVVRLRGYGNAIVPHAAAAFVAASE